MIYDINGNQISVAYGLNGEQLSNAFDINGNSIFDGGGSSLDSVYKRAFGVAKIGDAYQVRWKYGDKVMAQSIIDGASENGGMDGGVYQLLASEPSNKSTIASGTFYKSFLDDICPLHYEGTFRGGGHGEDTTWEITADNYNVSESDIGRLLTDKNGVNFVVYSVIDANTFRIISDFTGNDKAPISKATPVSPLGSITFSDVKKKMMHPDINNRTFYVSLADGTRITSDGYYQSDYIDFVENYHILNLKDMVMKLKSNVGNNTNTSYYADSVSADFIYEQLYRFYPNGVCVVYAKIIPQREGLYLDSWGGIQVRPMGGIINIPFTNDYSGLYEMQTGETIELYQNTWSDSNFPPYKWQQYSADNGRTDWGFALGYCIEKGSCVPNIRKEMFSAGMIFSSKVNYPNIYYKTGNPVDVYGTTIEGYCFRTPVDKSNGYTAFSYEVDGITYAELEFYNDFSGEIYLYGIFGKENVSVIASDGNISVSNAVNGDKITVASSGIASATIKISY